MDARAVCTDVRLCAGQLRTELRLITTMLTKRDRKELDRRMSNLPWPTELGRRPYAGTFAAEKMPSLTGEQLVGEARVWMELQGV